MRRTSNRMWEEGEVAGNSAIRLYSAIALTSVLWVAFHSCRYSCRYAGLTQVICDREA